MLQFFPRLFFILAKLYSLPIFLKTVYRFLSKCLVRNLVDYYLYSSFKQSNQISLFKTFLKLLNNSFMKTSFMLIALLAILLASPALSGSFPSKSIASPFGLSNNYWLFGGKTQLSISGQLAQTIEFQTEFYKCSSSNIYYGAVKHFSINGDAPAVAGYPFAVGPSQPFFKCDYSSLIAYQLSYPSNLDSETPQNQNGKIWTDLIKLSCDNFNPRGKSTDQNLLIQRLGEKDPIGNARDIRKVSKFSSGVQKVLRDTRFKIQGVEGLGQNQNKSIEGEVESSFWVIEALRRTDLSCSELQSSICSQNAPCTVINQNDVNQNRVNDVRIEKEGGDNFQQTGNLRRMQSTQPIVAEFDKKLFQGTIIFTPITVNSSLVCIQQSPNDYRCNQLFFISIGSSNAGYRVFEEITNGVTTPSQVTRQIHFYIGILANFGGRTVTILLPAAFTTVGAKAFTHQGAIYNANSRIHYNDTILKGGVFSNYRTFVYVELVGDYVNFNSSLVIQRPNPSKLLTIVWKKIVPARSWKWRIFVYMYQVGSYIDVGQITNVPASQETLFSYIQP